MTGRAVVRWKEEQQRCGEVMTFPENINSREESGGRLSLYVAVCHSLRGCFLVTTITVFGCPGVALKEDFSEILLCVKSGVCVVCSSRRAEL